MSNVLIATTTIIRYYLKTRINDSIGVFFSSILINVPDIAPMTPHSYIYIFHIYTNQWFNSSFSTFVLRFSFFFIFLFVVPPYSNGNSSKNGGKSGCCLSFCFISLLFPISFFSIGSWRQHIFFVSLLHAKLSTYN